MILDTLRDALDAVYEALCRDNDEKPTPAGRQLFEEKAFKDSRFFAENGALSLQHCRLGLHSSIALVKSLKDTPLKSLDLTDNIVQDYGVVALIQLLKNCPTLSTIKLGSNGIGNEGIVELSNVVPDLRQLTTLDLGNDPSFPNKNTINGEGASRLAHSIGKNFAVQSLNLAGTRMGKTEHLIEVSKAFANMLRINRGLIVLNLERNGLGTTGTSLLIESLARNRALRHLKLSRNEIGADIGRSISIALSSNTTLIHLDLSQNAVGRGVTDFAQALASNTSLISLNLHSNEISDGGAIALAEVLRRNQYITSLDISKNSIGERGGQEISQALGHTQVLTNLDISCNNIRDSSAMIAAESMVKNESLLSLDMSSCKISDDGAVAISTALGSNEASALRVLRLRDNYISSSAGQIIVDELRANRSITSADFRGNRMDHTKLQKIKNFCKRNLHQIRMEVPKRLQEQIIQLKEETHKWRKSESELIKHQESIAQAMAELDVINLEKQHFMFKQNAEREEITKRVSQEEKQIRQTQAKIEAKKKEIENAKEARGKRICKLTAQWEQEKSSREKIENELKEVSEQLSCLDVKPELELHELQKRVDEARREKVKYQQLMSGIRSKLLALQNTHKQGRPIFEYMERARYVLLHPEETHEELDADPEARDAADA